MTYLVTGIGPPGFIASQFLESVPDATPAPPSEDPHLLSSDTLIHLGAMAGIGECLKDPHQAFVLNVADTLNLLQVVADAGAKMVFASSSAAARPLNPYAASKASSEAWCRAYRESYNTRVSILRFANVYGEGSMHKTSCVAQMCRDALEKGVITMTGIGHQLRDFVYVGDVVKALADAPMGGEFSVKSGTLHTVQRVAAILSDMSGATIVCGERPQGDVDKPSDSWPQFPMKYTPIEEGLRKTWAWYKEQANA